MALRRTPFAVLTAETTPGPTVTADALNTFIKINSGTEYHPLGSAAMMPKEMGGVVDTNLVVYVRPCVRSSTETSLSCD